MNKYCLIFLIVFSNLVVHHDLKAQPQGEPTVKIGGEVASPFDLKIADLDQFPQTEVIRKDKDGKDHIYTGVLLSAILQKAGAPSGKDLHGKALSKYVLVEASDSYRVVFALAETDKDFTDRMIILADKVDGKPMIAPEGPFRIIVQNEKKPARCIRMVTSVKVLYAP